MKPGLLRGCGTFLLSPFEHECGHHAKPCKKRQIDANNWKLDCDCGCTAVGTRKDANSYTSVAWDRSKAA